MASWIGLAFLILLSANAVFSNDYKDKLIDEDPYLSQCIISTGTGNLKYDGVKKIHSGPECYAKTKIQFKVDGYGVRFITYKEQGRAVVAPAKITYKFGDCYDLKIEIKKIGVDKFVYVFHKPDTSTVDLGEGFMFRMVRRGEQGSILDTMEVLFNDWSTAFSKECNAFQIDPQDNTYTLMDFAQNILEGVPDLTLVWNVPDDFGYGKYFGRAYAKDIKELGTSTTSTTTTAMPTSVPEKAFPWWIIGVAVGGALVLLIALLVGGYLCWRHSRAQKPKQDEKTDRSTFGTTMQTVQEKSQNEPNVMYFEKAAPSAPIQAISPASQASPMQAAK